MKIKYIPMDSALAIIGICRNNEMPEKQIETNMNLFSDSYLDGYIEKICGIARDFEVRPKSKRYNGVKSAIREQCYFMGVNNGQLLKPIALEYELPPQTEDREVRCWPTKSSQCPF
jgi:hypothetical protein